MNASDLVERIGRIEQKLRGRRGVFDVKSLETTKPLPEATVRVIEREIGHRLPELLRELYTTVGGTLAFRWRFKKGKAQTFYAKGTWGAEPWGTLAIDEPAVEETGDGTTYVRFGDDGNGRQYALDYAGKKGPRVVSYDHERIDDARVVARDAVELFEALSKRGFMHVEDDTEELDAFFAES
jgi:hypothetical protein